MIWKKLVMIKKGSEIYIREMVNLSLTSREHPKVCVNLQTDVR